MPKNWITVREFYGLRKPSTFNVAIPFLLNGFVLIVVLVVCAFLFCDGALNLGTARFYFFSYVVCLLAIAAVFSRARGLSYTFLIWCTIELSLALGSHILAKRGDLLSLLPENISPAESEKEDPGYSAFMYHPLLQTVPRPNSHYMYRFDFEGEEDTAKGAGIDVASLRGQEIDFVHNSMGLRGKELTADDVAKPLIFIYGGSTTYDPGITQGETWVEHLQSDLDNKYTILNFSVPDYTTVEHLIQTAFYQDVVKKKPVCAIYYLGWHDAGEIHIRHLDNAYADYHLLANAYRKPDLFVAKFSPLGSLLNQAARKRFDTVPSPPQLPGSSRFAGRDEHLEAIFIEHLKTIAAINEARSIKTIFIGQILNKSWHDNPNAFQSSPAEDFVTVVERFKSILKDTAASIGTKYIDPEVTNFGGNDFVDFENLGVPGARKFAAAVSTEVGNYCR